MSTGIFIWWYNSSCCIKPSLGSANGRLSRIWATASEGLMLYLCIRYAATQVADRDLPMALYIHQSHALHCPFESELQGLESQNVQLLVEGLVAGFLQNCSNFAEIIVSDDKPIPFKKSWCRGVSEMRERGLTNARALRLH